MQIKLIGYIAIVSLLPACASAQTHADTVHQRNDCRLASQVVATGHPAPHMDWALQLIGACGRDGGAALAAAIRRTQQSADIPSLDALTQATRTFRDGEVFTAARDVAADRGASIPARVFAFRTMLTALSQGRVLSYAQMTRSDAERACAGLLPSTHDKFTDGSPLPLDARNAAQEVAAALLAGEAAAPPEVMQAARCLMRYTR